MSLELAIKALEEAQAAVDREIVLENTKKFGRNFLVVKKPILRTIRSI